MTSEAAARAERWATILLRLSVAGSVVVCVAGIFLVTAGTDECWILGGARGLAEHGRFGAGAHHICSHSTGGLHTAIATVLHVAGRGRLEVIRLLSPLSLAALFALLLLIADRALGRRDPARWCVAASILGVHGLFLLGSQAYGEILASVLVFGGVLLWCRERPDTWRRRLIVGLIFGLACAVRPNCMAILPALLAVSLLASGRRRAEAADAGVACLAAGMLFWIQWTLAVRTSIDPGAPAQYAGAYGVASFWSLPLAYLIPLRLSYFMIGQDHLGLFAAVAISVAWLRVRTRVADRRPGDVLLFFAWFLWLAWVANAPIPHLRYLWPALVSFFAVGGLALASIAADAPAEKQPFRRWAGLAISLACVATGYLDGARTLLFGEGDVLSFEWHRGSSHSTQYGPFKHVRHQRDVVRRLREMPPGEEVATISSDTALSFLTRRPLAPASDYYRGKDQWALRPPPGVTEGRFPRWLLLTPTLNRHPASQITSALHQWIERNGRLDARYGPYVLYEIVGSWPRTVDVFTLSLWEAPLPLALPPR